MRAVAAWLTFLALSSAFAARPASAYDLNDTHFHLTNYVQMGPDADDFLALMGDKVGRVALFGIPLQQTWSYENSGDYAPTYYLHSDVPSTTTPSRTPGSRRATWRSLRSSARASTP